MSAWDRIGREEAADRAMTLFDKIKDLWKASNGDVGPPRAAYNTALNALFKLGT